MTFHEWFKTLPRTMYCPKCRSYVTVWHKHWGKK